MSQPPYPQQPAYGWGTPPPPPVPRRRWPRALAWVAGLVALGVVIGGGAALLTKDDGTSASPAACKRVLTEGYRKAMANGGKGPEQKRPPECAGLDTKTLERITGEVISEYLASDQAKDDLGKAVEDGMRSAFPTPSESAGVSPECREWMAKELQDGSSSIDGTGGYAACGDLSDAEMQAAIDDVVKELEASITASP
ncbi:hypothetical protein M2164_005901 [Streptomyces sp. SAI-208]|uniref:hypothetical protein n=1 Tax=Streptomyces sp. SAI-208 TaxID=2940550 RepID=UPI0024730448|nr:hypothetical protein [Streptomyces sp. SAI-208]MDH6610266.1 hypothetical protein [Streptomyces sp. SAI-208]